MGPAERTGKPSSRYWPGGSRRPGLLRRPMKPLEKNPFCHNLYLLDPARTVALAKSCRPDVSRPVPGVATLPTVISKKTVNAAIVSSLPSVDRETLPSILSDSRLSSCSW